MYLSRIVLNPERTGAKKLVSSRRAMHAAIQKAFPDNGDRIGWRLDTSQRDPIVYVLSPSVPSFDHIVEQAGRINDDSGIVIKNFDGVLASISNGTRLIVQSEINATKMDKRTRKRIPLIREEDFDQWVANQGSQHGFTVLGLGKFQQKTPISVRKDNSSVTLDRVLAEFAIEVTDNHKFVEFVKNGMGRGKAYGLGMIALRKP